MSSRPTPLVSLSPLDQQRFGIRTARASDLAPATLPEVLRFCGEHGVVLLIARCSVAEPAAAQALERHGFLLMDTLVFYGCDVAKAPVATWESDGVVRLFQRGEESAIAGVAAAAFRDYPSHYHADARLDRSQCDQVYPSWAVRTCTVPEAADEVLVAELDGSIAGFAAIRRDHAGEMEVVLFAVDPARQRRGIARSLLLDVLARCRSKGVASVVYSTQITNWPIQRTLVRLGFEPIRASYTYHGWLDTP